MNISMRSALLACVVLLVGGSAAECFADAEEAGERKKRRSRPFPPKDIDDLLKLQRKVPLNAVQTLAYHRYREIVEPKLIEIFKRENGSQDDRNDVRKELAIRGNRSGTT